MRKFALILAIALVAGGCARVTLSTRGVGKDVVMTKTARSFEVIKHFSESSKAHFWVFSLVTGREPKLEEIVERQVASVDGDAAINVRIKGQTEFVDGLVAVLVSPIFSMRTYTIEGDIIRYTE